MHFYRAQRSLLLKNILKKMMIIKLIYVHMYIIHIFDRNVLMKYFFF